MTCGWNLVVTRVVLGRRRRILMRSQNPACGSIGITASFRCAILRGHRCSRAAGRPRLEFSGIARIFASNIRIGRRCRSCSRIIVMFRCARVRFITAELMMRSPGARRATRAGRRMTEAGRQWGIIWKSRACKFRNRAVCCRLCRQTMRARRIRTGLWCWTEMARGTGIIIRRIERLRTCANIKMSRFLSPADS
jgi:hypothetical protein